MKNKEKKSLLKRWWFWVIAIIIIAGIFAPKDENNIATTTNAENTASKSEDKQEEAKEEVKEEVKEEEKLYNIGDSFETGKLGVVINSVEEKTEFASDNQFIQGVTTEGKFVVVTAQLTNNDTEARTFSSSQFKLKDDKDRSFEALTSAELMMILGDQNLFLESCNPGMSRSGVFVFEVPSDVESYSIEVSSGFGFAGLEKETVKLK